MEYGFGFIAQLSILLVLLEFLIKHWKLHIIGELYPFALDK